MIAFSDRLPRHRDLLSLLQNNQLHPLSKNLTMVAVMLSRRDRRVMVFQEMLSTSSWNHGGRAHKNNTVWPGINGIFGVLGNNLIPLKRLKSL